VVDARKCSNAKRIMNQFDSSFQLTTPVYNIDILPDILVSTYLNISLKQYNEVTHKESVTLLESWKVMFESETTGKIETTKIDIFKKVSTCSRAVWTLLRMLPTHKLIRQKTKLNLSFDLEYEIVDKSGNNEFKNKAEERACGFAIKNFGKFIISVSYLSDLKYLKEKKTDNQLKENYIQKNTRNDRSNSQTQKSLGSSPLYNNLSKTKSIHSSPLNNSRVNSPHLSHTGLSDPPLVETPTFKLLLSSFPSSLSHYSDYDNDSDDIILSGIKSANLSPIFKSQHWKDLGLSTIPTRRSMNGGDLLRLNESEKLDHFRNMVKNPPQTLLEQINDEIPIATYADKLDKFL